ncbi:Demethylsterigmatocystin 6-O-methyltransferase 8 [Colletotrichum musicola]|uniref:Demethylsterigmatocystin 6-O-methyltransferase 8 n=1 Tax=Colletotrichum musicola TaxID=2175873 RepID=A0A8H6NJQ2_9PEZI|nr:Demethylsterigmatocystin 6-O-methyltransferase 8 [Colletotrichum musicola]
MGSIPERLHLDPSVAVKPSDFKIAAELSAKISTLGASLSPDDNESRLELLRQARSLVQALETPRETMVKHLWAQPGVGFAIAAGVESGLFKYMVANPGPRKVKELASALGFDADVLARLIRHLGSNGYLKEVGKDEYEPTSFTKALSLPTVGDGYSCAVGGVWPTFCNFPKYLRKYDRRISEDSIQGPLQDVIGADGSFFQHIKNNFPAGEFQNFMAGYGQGRALWMDLVSYPGNERLIQGADASPETAFILDIGGGIGRDLDEFCRKHPGAPGRHVPQDLPHVITQVEGIDPKIEAMAYDFLMEQPVVDARAYYMRSVLHDWTDEVCGEMLARVAKAMRPGYSRLLLNENVILPTGADWQTTALDMVMMTIFASRERTDEQWRGLLEQAGLRIIKIWSRGEGVESLIECELA